MARSQAPQMGGGRRLRAPGFRERSVLAARARVAPWGGIAVSLLAHLTVFGGFFAYAHVRPPRIVPPKPIVARLVRLGTPRDEKLLPRLPAPSAPAPPPEEKAVAVPTKPPEPAKPAVPAVPAKAVEPPKAAESAEKQAIERQKRMAEALARLGPPPAGPTGKKVEELPGRADGDRRGTAEDAAAGDRYLALVQEALKGNYSQPNAIPMKEYLHLSCKIRLFIRANGKIERFKIVEGSGNALYDRAVEATLQRTTLPPPPPAALVLWAKDGIGFEFKP